MPGKPLVYNGQELNHLKVDPSPAVGARQKLPVYPFYQKTLDLYRSQDALNGGTFTKLVSDRDDKVYAFMRQKGANRVVVAVNLSDQSQTVTLQNASLAGQYRDWFGGGTKQLSAKPTLKLAPWNYQVLVAGPNQTP